MFDSLLLQVPEPFPHLVVLVVDFAEHEVVQQIAHAVMERLQRIDAVRGDAILQFLRASTREESLSGSPVPRLPSGNFR